MKDWKGINCEPELRSKNAGISTFTVRVSQYNWTSESPSD